MKKLNLLYLFTTTIALSTSNGYAQSKDPHKYPWDGFFVGGLLGSKIISGEGKISTIINSQEKISTKNDILFPVPYHTLLVGFSSQFNTNSTIAFESSFDYGVLPSLKVSYGYLATPLDRISLGLGVDVSLFSMALSGKNDLDVSSLFGFTPSLSYERSIGNGAFFQSRLSYNYLNIKSSSLNNDFKAPLPVKRFIRDYWDKDVDSLKDLYAAVHGFTLSLGFGYTF